jgi:hypothetical protein
MSVVTSFDLQSHHQAILNHISIGTLSSSAHFWDPKMFAIIRDCGYKCSDIFVVLPYISPHLYPQSLIIVNILGSPKCALLLNASILKWFEMA